MEVHHHPHTPRKKWTHYFWEFLMLFLAVLCGYLAEYQLEHAIEHQREKKLICSYINDLATDTAVLNRYIQQEKSLIQYGDSLIYFLSSGTYLEFGSRTYYAARRMLLGGPFSNTDGTITQLKNAGGFRLIRKQGIVDSINNYDLTVRALKALDDINKEGRILYSESLQEVLNNTILHAMTDHERNIIAPPGNPQLFSADHGLLNKFVGRTSSLAKASLGKKRMAEQLKVKAALLIELIKKEYNIK